MNLFLMLRRKITHQATAIMTTASMLFTVTTSWTVTSEKVDKEGCVALTTKTIAAEAAKELRETNSTKEQGLRLMINWIQQNTDIKNVRQDEAFLLRFLRHKKYSIPMAQQTLLKYLSLRSYYPEIFKNLDSEDKTLRDIINDGYIAVSPVRDSKGRRVIVYNINNLNSTKYNCWDMCRVHCLVYESLLDDPMDQICGFSHIGDGTGVCSGHITSWNPSDFARILKWGEQSLPMRHKEFHLINVPSAVKYIVDFAMSKVSPKMSERLHIYSNMKSFHKNVDKGCLPKQFGGELSFDDMIQYTKKIVTDKRQTVLDLDQMEILSTKGIISSRRTNTKPNADSVEGSFRKLEID